MRRFCLCIALIGSCYIQVFAQPTEASLTLPVYHLEIDSSYLDQLDQAPYSNIEYPAYFLFDGRRFPVEVRYRGGSSRNLPKKSWRIVFEDTDNPVGRKVLLLNAEYRDGSFMRNHLTMKLFQHFDRPAPDTRFVNLFVNQIHRGVLVEVEAVDNAFLKRHGREPYSLFKSINHSANFVPVLKTNDFEDTWEQKIGGRLALADMHRLLAQLTYWTDEAFQVQVADRVDVENVIDAFALQFVVANTDGFIKNFYLNYDPASGRYEMIPWDADATFGLDWKAFYDPTRIQFYDGWGLDRSILFQRLIEYEPWRTAFWDRVLHITETGVPHLLSWISEAYDHIKHDVYQDRTKRVSNAAFDADVARLADFITHRAEFLGSAPPFDRQRLSDVSITNPFPTTDDPVVTIQVRAAEPTSSLNVDYSTDLNLQAYNDRFTIQSMPLYDDGFHNDLEAGDLVYGNMISVPSAAGLVPLVVRDDIYRYPANGFLHISIRPTDFYAVHASVQDPNAYSLLTFGTVQTTENNVFIPLQNPTSGSVDLSLCQFQAGASFQRITFAPGTVLAPGASFILTTNPETASYLFPDHESAKPLFFRPTETDTLRLLSPGRTLLAETPVVMHSLLDTEMQPHLVINEVNYQSDPAQDTGDWIELYNPNPEPVSLDHWAIQDEQDDHRFRFPDDAVIPGGGYAIVARDTTAFRAYFPDVPNLYGNLNFGLGGTDAVRLFTPLHQLVEALHYGDGIAWPEDADGQGATLERIDPDQPADTPVNWQASAQSGGSPGQHNTSSPLAIEDRPVPARLDGPYPNPFSDRTRMAVSLKRPGHVTITVYDLLGRRVDTLVDAELMPVGSTTILWDASGLVPGLYVYSLEVDAQRIQTRTALVLR